MRTYYFHLTDGSIVEPDDVGQLLPDDAAALTEAHRFLREIRSDLEQPRAAYVTVVDQQGNEVGCIPAMARNDRLPS